MSPTIFQDQSSATAALQRLSELTGIDLPPSKFQGAPEADQALSNLERWIGATSSPSLQMQQLADSGPLGDLLIYLLGASQPLANTLIQNPELASIVFEFEELARVPDQQEILAHGRRLLADATSFSHSLDRLRYLKQRWTLPIVVNDLSGKWDPETVWRALSDLATSLITLVVEVVWRDRGTGSCPLMIVGFGKLGGRELNYSSDIDLVFVAEDGSDEKALTRICEAIVRAVSETMGRGFLYRIDLRLRPFGSAGSVVSSWRGIENYYRLYAEPWELQALLKSMPVCGPETLASAWENLRQQHCFKPRLSSEALESVLAMRKRTEAGAEEADLKRASGGIRDVEFIVQILQMAHGHAHPALQGRGTAPMLEALEREGIIDHAIAAGLVEGYTFLRQLEHRIQFESERQTHVLPADPARLTRLAKLMGLSDATQLSNRLDFHRRTIESLYRSILQPDLSNESNQTALSEVFGTLMPVISQWFEVLPESEAFIASLLSNEGSARRIKDIAHFAPRLVEQFKRSVPLTELLMSGEIEEEFTLAAAIDELPIASPPRQVAEAYTNTWTRVIARWLLTREGNLGQDLAGLSDAFLRHCSRRLYAEFDLIALGSLGLGEMSPDSDADILLLVPSKERHIDAETHAQFLLNFVANIKRLGAPVQVDLRLRPEGGKGLLVRTYDGFKQYELESMEMWERFALGQARLISGSEEALELVKKAAYAQPLTPERLKELLSMKRRIETERVAPQYTHRQVKLGYGGLADIEWFVHLHEMRYPGATNAGEAVRTDERIRSLARALIINALEADVLIAARAHLQEVRTRLGLLGYSKDIVPENPDKLDRLAHSCGFEEGNSFLKHHENVLESVRTIYKEGLERLKA